MLNDFATIIQSHDGLLRIRFLPVTHVSLCVNLLSNILQIVYTFYGSEFVKISNGTGIPFINSLLFIQINK